MKISANNFFWENENRGELDGPDLNYSLKTKKLFVLYLYLKVDYAYFGAIVR